MPIVSDVPKPDLGLRRAASLTVTSKKTVC
jgi:hypothetical protein